MNFQEAEKTYKELAAQHSAGKLNDTAFEAEVGKLRMQDEQGRWWQIGVQTGDWYMHDGQKWNKAKPPTPAPTPAPAPTPTPAPTPAPVAAVPAPQPSPSAEKPSTPTPAKPGKEDKKSDAAPKAKDDAKQTRASATPRLFSAKPAGREGGLSRPMLIGIIAIVAIVILLLLVGVYFVANNVLGTASKQTVTPTRAIAILPSPALPTVVPTQVPTDTPLAPPTLVVTATVPLTGTTPTATFKTPAPPKPTATKKPAGTPAPSATATPNVPPGVYAVSIETVPPQASLGSMIGFKVDFLNTTGTMQTYTIMVKVFKCPEQCQDFKNSYGETLRASGNIATGSSSFTTSQNINLGVGLNCNLVAIPYYVDPTNQQVVPFPSLKGNPLYQSFKICQ